MTKVPSYEDFADALKRLEVLERENEYLRTVVTDLQWLTVAQVAKACRCSQRTVTRLIDSNKLVNRKEGSKSLCNISSVRSYLLGKKVDEQEINYRLMGACLHR
ncbi:helix-turn-helix domain-containing protein [Spirosoma foliorum]|uniref:Helix-turn-helix domain-containing protein n=1 Tax=Spirosoma foliorum TaxID=2710596 RepID=A0A7G5H5D2_9BACT|nr:helix-turn-helix domain-containing protein [Spirosoma foliorum]QMW06324.1 helix-turn-helix domain-containing protein [Spirosoma foliorum]